MTPRVAILDYGNIRSVINAVRKTGGGEAYQAAVGGLGIHQATHIIIPGQGHFGDIAPLLALPEWVDELNRARDRGVPILGICLGMQLMCEGSEEALGVKGLNWIPSMVKRLSASRLPHIGWNHVAANDYYFCHSYAVPWNAQNPLAGGQFAASCEYKDQLFLAEFHRDNLWAVQFHPEKSGQAGLALLTEFLRL